MDYCSFYFGTGVAIFLVLLVWGNQISNQRNEVLELEERFIKTIGQRKSTILPLLRDPSKYSFSRLTSSLIDCLQDRTINQEFVKYYNQITHVYSIFKKLTRCYEIKFLTATVMVALSFLFGTICGLLNDFLFFKIVSAFEVMAYFFISLIFCILIMYIYINSLEKRFISKIQELLDEMER